LAISTTEKDIFTTFDCASTAYVFNEAGETDHTAVQIDVADYNEITAAFWLETLASTSAEFIVLGKVGSIWGTLYYKSYSAAETYGEIIPISVERVSFIAIGGKVTANASGDKLHASVALSNTTYN